MLKQGDIVAFRQTPTQPIGQVQVVAECGDIGEVRDGLGRKVTTFFLSNGCADCPERPHRDDVVLYKAAAEPTHYIVCAHPSSPQYGTLEEAQAKAKEWLSTRPNSSVAIYSAVELHQSEVKVNVKKLG
jgi:hypothetical protein